MKTLYIGAHQDDVFIGAGINISKNPKEAVILTLSDGRSAVKYPWTTGGKIFKNSDEYFKQRLLEDRSAMAALGVNVNNNYFNGKFPDGKTHENIPGIVSSIEKIIKMHSIEKIVTHSAPEAHPDHEVAWFCSHIVGGRNNIDVFEFVTYRIDGDGKYVRTFLDESQMKEIEEIRFNTKEQKFRNHVASLYTTQKHIINIFDGSKEIIGKRKKFNLDRVPETPYYYKNRKGFLQPNQIRQYMKNFEKNQIPLNK